MASLDSLLYFLTLRSLSYELWDGHFVLLVPQLLHAARVCARLWTVPATATYSLPHYLAAVFALSLGGGSLVSLALARPFSWLMRNEVIVSYLVVALAFRYMPRLRSLANNPLIALLLAFADGICRASATADTAIEPILFIAPTHTVVRPVVPCVLAGVVAAVGGGLADSLVGFSLPSWRLDAPRVAPFTSPDVILALVCSTVYVLLRIHPILPRDHTMAITLCLSSFGVMAIHLMQNLNAPLAPQSSHRGSAASHSSGAHHHASKRRGSLEITEDYARVLSSGESAGPVATRTRSSLRGELGAAHQGGGGAHTSHEEAAAGADSSQDAADDDGAVGRESSTDARKGTAVQRRSGRPRKSDFISAQSGDELDSGDEARDSSSASVAGSTSRRSGGAGSQAGGRQGRASSSRDGSTSPQRPQGPQTRARVSSQLR